MKIRQVLLRFVKAKTAPFEAVCNMYYKDENFIA